MKPDYTLEKQAVLDINSEEGNIVLGSCNIPNVKTTQVCSGKGICIPWDPTGPIIKSADEVENDHDVTDGIYKVCRCDRDWAGKECRTKRQSKLTAYFLSVFLGWLGLDRLYLGHTVLGVFKFLTLGGGGLLWIYDVVAISSGNIYAKEYRVADDMLEGLPMLLTPAFFMLFGFTVSMINVLRVLKRKREMAMCFGQWEDGFIFSKAAQRSLAEIQEALNPSPTKM